MFQSRYVFAVCCVFGSLWHSWQLVKGIPAWKRATLTFFSQWNMVPWYNLQTSRAKYFYKLFFFFPHMIPQPYLECSDWKSQLCMSCNVAGRKWGGGGSYWLKLWLVQPTTHHQLQTNMGVFSFVCVWFPGVYKCKEVTSGQKACWVKIMRLL